MRQRIKLIFYFICILFLIVFYGCKPDHVHFVENQIKNIQENIDYTLKELGFNQYQIIVIAHESLESKALKKNIKTEHFSGQEKANKKTPFSSIFHPAIPQKNFQVHITIKETSMQSILLKAMKKYILII